MTFLWVLLVSSLLVSPAFAQKVEVDLSELGTNARNEVINANAKKQVVDTPKQVSQWVGVGKEIGEAVNTGLNSVVDSAEKFGKTSVGNFTMWLIFWKLMGAGLLKLAITLLWSVTGLSIVLWSYRRVHLPRNMLVEKTPDRTKRYQVMSYEFKSNDAKAVSASVHAVIFALIMLITLLVFANII